MVDKMYSGNSTEQEMLVPIANVGRIMKQILPANAKVSKEAKETMQECVSEFISFVTGEASDRCHKVKRKTINGDDVCWAMSSLGFDDYADALRTYLHRYREAEGEKAAANHIHNNNNNNHKQRPKSSSEDDEDEDYHGHSHGQSPKHNNNNMGFNFRICDG